MRPSSITIAVTSALLYASGATAQPADKYGPRGGWGIYYSVEGNKFHAGFQGEGPKNEFSGTLVEDATSVTFQVERRDSGQGPAPVSETVRCSKVAVTDDLEFTEKILCPGNASPLWNLHALVPPGSPRQVAGIPVITINAWGDTSSELKVRTGPGQGYPSHEKIYADEYSPPLSYLKKGASIRILARTADKKMVGSISNYWYYIAVYNAGDLLYGWVFAQYVTQKADK